ncbi:tumor necrosis factor ligand superfamily member 18 [Myripristis murdjan]|uniref:tumor necrosis factor ligand superfamily member 18 n=1 Tax=Myripristis murdjan TaxID=586833 RepID=UPI001175C856|nr:uncharacterized protein LOC115364190 [Myripristis murdjan]
MQTLSSGSKQTSALVHSRGNYQELNSCQKSTSLPALPGLRAALSTALRLMMPQPIEHRLVCPLLLWITVLTIGQMAFITFFFTAVYPGLRTSDVDRGSEKSSQSIGEPKHFAARMISLRAEKDPQMPGSNNTNSLKTIEWMVEGSDLLSPRNKKNLTLSKDGYYFLCLQVTFQEEEKKQEYFIHLRKNGKILLYVRVNTKSSNTGFLGKMVEGSARDKLEVTIAPQAKIDDNYTYLGIMYLPKHYS